MQGRLLKILYHVITTSYLLFYSPLFASPHSTPLLSENPYFPQDLEVYWLAGISEEVVRPKEIDHYQVQCFEDPSLAQTDEKCRFLKFFQGITATPLNGSFLGEKSDVLIFGDSHMRPEIAHLLASQLADLKTAGFTHFAMEMFNASSQAKIDAYQNGDLSFEQISQVLKKEFNSTREGHLFVLKTANELGFKIVGIEDRTELDRIRKASDHSWSFSELLNGRDIFMSSNILTWHKLEPNARWVIFAGNQHSFLKQSMQGHIKGLIEMIQEGWPEVTFKTYLMMSSTNKPARTILELLKRQATMKGPYRFEVSHPYFTGYLLTE
ncbi:MAG: ChaN family lipoprotein [Bdellovibrionales bacterium]|nr:ChaN family lipoprotein [Bdellovibrionales bacterium]